MKFYLVIDVKYELNEYGIPKRIDLRTIHSTFELALESAKDNFCDEAGWYDGFLIEEREEDTIFFKGKRVFYIYDKSVSGKYVWKEIPEPDWAKDCINLI